MQMYTLNKAVDGGEGYSSVVEHLTADQEVSSFNLGTPLFFHMIYHYYNNISLQFLF